MDISQNEKYMFKVWAKAAFANDYKESMDIDKSLKLFFQRHDNLPGSLVKEIKLGVYSRIALYIIWSFDKETIYCGSVDQLVGSSFLEFTTKIKEFSVAYNGFFSKIQEIQDELLKISTSKLAELLQEFDSDVENTLKNISDFFIFYREVRKLILDLESNHRILYDQLKLVDEKFPLIEDSYLLLNTLGNSLERISKNL